jgi:uncharacterized membrane protein YfcA
MEFLTAPDIGPLMFAGLAAASFATAFIGVFTGTAGGLILLAIMATVMPPAALIPVHTVVQLGSGVSRTLIMWRWVMRATLLPFMVGAALGAFIGAQAFVSMPQSATLGILAVFILVVTWLPKLGRMGAQNSRFAMVGFGATFLGVFVSATGTLVAPFVASAAADRRNQVATMGALMISVHVLKLVAFTFIGFSIWPYSLLMGAMIATGAAGNWLGEIALNYTSEQRFRMIFQIVLTILALRLLWRALADSGWF